MAASLNPSQQMVIKQHEDETRKEKRERQIRNSMVYNDWGLCSFVQMLEYQCLCFGKDLYIIDERDTGVKRTPRFISLQ